MCLTHFCFGFEEVFSCTGYRVGSWVWSTLFSCLESFSVLFKIVLFIFLLKLLGWYCQSMLSALSELDESDFFAQLVV
jgi:hypothetical protein